ncbi:hypothetical protein GINT2_002214 [Glugoides intestinalis]
MDLIFPFSIAGKQRISTVETSAERAESTISFALPFNLAITIPAARLISRSLVKGNFLFVFEFNSLDEAIGWMEKKQGYVEQVSTKGNSASIQAEINEVMAAYEQKEKRKKVKMVDEDGFVYYE